MPDRDDNAMRRVTVTSGKGSTGLRAVRKNHKVSLLTRKDDNAESCSNTSGRGRRIDFTPSFRNSPSQRGVYWASFSSPFSLLHD
jgi:hypothetical protein